MSAAALAGLAKLLGSLDAQARRAARSVLETRSDRNIVQRWGARCGAAALATNLHHYCSESSHERAVVEAIRRRTDPLRLKHLGGFSLPGPARSLGGGWHHAG